MSKSHADLEKFKRRLIKVVARMINEGLDEEELWKRLKLQTKANYRVLWSRMRSLTLKKLRLLFNVGDICSKVPLVARMTFTDWLMFDLVLVNEANDMISLVRSGQEEEASEASKPQPPILWDLFHLVKRHGIETKTGYDFVKAWVDLTVEYNAPITERQCSPMLLQLRWHLLKEKTRNSFYAFWKNFGKLSKNKEEFSKLTPNELFAAIAKTYPKVVTDQFLPWKSLVESGHVVNPTQFQRKKQRSISTEDDDCSGTPCTKTDGKTATAITGDVEVIEPQIETITVLDDDSDDQQDENKEKSSQYQQSKPSTSTAIIKTTDAPSKTEDRPVTTNISKRRTENDVVNIDSQEKRQTGIKIDDNEKQQEVINIDNIDDCIDNTTEQAVIDQEEAAMKVDQDALNAFCGEQYIVNSFDDYDIDQELIDTKPIVLPEIDGLSQVKIIGTTHIQTSVIETDKNDTKLSSPIKVISETNSESDKISKVSTLVDKNEVPDKDKEANQVPSLLKQDISPDSVINSVIKIEELDIRDELKRNGKEDLLKIIPKDNSSNMVFDIIDDGIEFNDGDDDAAEDDKDKAENDDSDPDDSTFKIDRKLLLCPIVYTVKLEEMNAVRKSESIDHVKTQRLIDKIFKESKIKTQEDAPPDIFKESKIQTNVDAPRDIEIEQEENPEEYDDPITVLPMNEPFLTEENNLEIPKMLEETANIPSSEMYTDSEEESIEPPIKRTKLSNNLFKKPKLTTYSPIQLCKNPDFNTRLKIISTGILVYQLNKSKILECKPLTIDLDKGFERKLVDKTVYLIDDENRTVGNATTSILSNLLANTLQNASTNSNSEESVLKLLLQKDESVYVRKQSFDDQELLAKRKSKTINLPDIDQVRKLNQRLLTAEVPPISVGIKEREFRTRTEGNVTLIIPKPNSPTEDNPAVTESEGITSTVVEQNSTILESGKIQAEMEPKDSLAVTVTENTPDEQTEIPIKQEKEECPKPDRYKSVENELTEIELATKDTLPDIEIIESKTSALKEMRKKAAQAKAPVKSNQRYIPDWCQPFYKTVPAEGLVAHDTLLKMLKVIQGEDNDDCVIIPDAKEKEKEFQKRNNANAAKRRSRMKKQAEFFFQKDEVQVVKSDDGLTVDVNHDGSATVTALPSTSRNSSKVKKKNTKLYIGVSENKNIHPQLSSFCCWIKEIEYRINLPNFNLDAVPHPCLYFNYGICTCCCREGANNQGKTEQEERTNESKANANEQQKKTPSLKITITPGNNNRPTISTSYGTKSQSENSKESIAIQTDLPLNNDKPTLQSTSVGTTPMLSLEPPYKEAVSMVAPEIMGILTADEIAHIEKKRKNVNIITVPVPSVSQQRKISPFKVFHKDSAVRKTVKVTGQADVANDCIVLSDDEENLTDQSKHNQSMNVPHLLIEKGLSTPIKVSNRPPLLFKKIQTHTPFKQVITHNKNQEVPLNLGENKVLLTTVTIPLHLNQVNLKRVNDLVPTETSNMAVTSPLINLPKGVGIVLLPDNTLSISLEPGASVTQGELEYLPTLLNLVQKQLEVCTGITQTILKPPAEISLLSDEENSTTKRNETEVSLAVEALTNLEKPEENVSNSNKVLILNAENSNPAISNDSGKEVESHCSEELSEENLCSRNEASNLNVANRNLDDSNESAKDIEQPCSEQLNEDMQDTSTSNIEDAYVKEIETTSLDLCLSKPASDSVVHEKEITETETPQETHNDYIGDQSTVTTTSPNKSITENDNSVSKETTPKSFLKVKDFAAVDNLEADANRDADSTQKKKTILSDLMEMSGISSEDTVASVMPSTIAFPVIPETCGNMVPPLIPIISEDGPLMTPLTENVLPRMFSEAAPGETRLELNPVFTIKALKYAHNIDGKFYVLHLDNGSIVPLRVSISKTKKVVVSKKGDFPKLIVPSTSYNRRKERLEPKIDLVDSDSEDSDRDQVEKESLSDDDDSSYTRIKSPLKQLQQRFVMKHLTPLNPTGTQQHQIVYKYTNDKPQTIIKKAFPSKRGEIIWKRDLKSKSLLKKHLLETSVKPALSNVIHAKTNEDKTNDLPEDKYYSSSDDEPLSILKDKKEKINTAQAQKRTSECDSSTSLTKRVRCDDKDENGDADDPKDPSPKDQTDNTEVTERESTSQQALKEPTEVSFDQVKDTEELNYNNNASNDVEMYSVPESSNLGEEVSEPDDVDFILGA